MSIVVAASACGSSPDAQPADDTVASVNSSDDSNGVDTSVPAPTQPPPPFTVEPLEPSPPSPPPASGSPGFEIDPASPSVVAAVDDLAGRLGIEPGAVSVVEARAVTWGDSSLGCPEPGMQYLQRLVDGSLVVLEAGGQRFEYHGGDPLFYCENPTPPSGGN